MSDATFLTEEHFLENLTFVDTDLYQSWERFLKLFVQKSPVCIEHPDIKLVKTFEKTDDGWVGKLSCPEGDYEETWTWPYVVNIWSWGDELYQKIQNTQVKTVKQGTENREKQIDDFVMNLLTKNKLLFNNKVNESTDTWAELGGLEQQWNYWLQFREMVDKRETERSEKMAQARLSQYSLLHQREEKWKEWLHFLVKEAVDIQQAWSYWGESVGWVVLEHEGKPTPRRMTELHGEMPVKMPIEAMEVWFEWSNLSRDYMNGLGVTEEIIEKLTEEGRRDKNTLQEFYIEFPKRGLGKLRGELQAMGDIEPIMMKPGLFVFPDDKNTMKGYEKMEELMEDPDMVIDGPQTQNMEPLEVTESDDIRDELMQQHSMKDMDTEFTAMRGAGDINNSVNRLDENFKEQDAKIKEIGETEILEEDTMNKNKTIKQE